MTRDLADAPCFRLRGEVDGVSSSFVLGAGEHTVGTDPTCDVVLPVRGVSRRHARIAVSRVGVEVRDTGSKNGSYVNEQDAAGKLALLGDELRFGPVSLRLETVDPEEAMLGLALDPLSRIEALPSRFETTLMSTSDSPTGEVHLGLLESVLDRLMLPMPDVEGALSELAGHFGALGAALVEWPADGAPVAHAASGEVGEVPTAGSLPASHPVRTWRALLDDGPPARTGVVGRRGDGESGLLLWGDFPERASCVELLALISKLLEYFQPRALAGIDGPPRSQTAELRFPAHIVRGDAPSMVALYQQMALLLQGDVPALILGETGVGKEHLAQALHDSSSRADGPFVAVNCAAIPSELLEAEMFGIGKGVATGVQPRRGKFSEAQGGTLFLDEIGDMSAELQAKLLRALQEKEIHPLGRAPESVDVRVVAATNTDLRRRIAENRFREDLYYRLAGYVLEVPPLRRRREDIPRLVGHFLRRFCRETQKPVRGVTMKALRLMTDYPWPGNVRELEHEVRRLVYVCPSHQAVDSEMLSAHILERPAPEPEPPGPDEAEARDDAGADAHIDAQIDAQADARDPDELGDEGLEARLESVERRLLCRALTRSAGNQSAAARLLKISRNGLAKRLKRLGIDASEFQV